MNTVVFGILAFLTIFICAFLALVTALHLLSKCKPNGKVTRSPRSKQPSETPTSPPSAATLNDEQTETHTLSRIDKSHSYAAVSGADDEDTIREQMSTQDAKYSAGSMPR